MKVLVIAPSSIGSSNSMRGPKAETWQVVRVINPAAILGFIERLRNFSQTTNFVQSSPNLGQIQILSLTN